MRIFLPSVERFYGRRGRRRPFFFHEESAMVLCSMWRSAFERALA
jgi:hypothetical protein